MRSSPPRPLARTRAQRITASAVAALLLLGTGVALAWTVARDNPANQVTAGTLPAPIDLALTRTLNNPGKLCTRVDLSWTPAGGTANGQQQIEYRIDAGAWTSLTSVAAGATSYAHVFTSPEQVEVAYRVRGTRSGSNWSSTWLQAAVMCGSGVGNVTDLDAQLGAACTDGIDLTWTAAAGATTYDIRHRINGGAWVEFVSNHAGTSYSATGIGGALVELQVRPGIGGGSDGNWSNVASVTDAGFSISTIAFANGGSAGSFDDGDQIIVTFNRAADTSKVVGATSLYGKTNGNPTGLYIGSTSAAISDTAIGWLQFNTYPFDAKGVRFDGTATWSGAGTVWTWTKNDGSSRSSSAPAAPTGFTPGTATGRVTCLGGGDLAAALPVLSGSF